MAVLPIPVQRYLVPPEPSQPPEELVRVEDKLLGGVPHSVQLGEGSVAVLIVPTGLATVWRDADPDEIVSRSVDQTVPLAEAPVEIGATGKAPARLLVRGSGGTPMGTVPLSLGVLHSLPETGTTNAGPRIELMLLSWDIRAGNLRGPGDFGGYISVAWRRADRGVEHYSELPVHPDLRPRLILAQRMESDLGRHISARRRRFKKGFAR